MNDFSFYFGIGWHHIISWNALDHILFIIALVAIYLVPNWKQVLILVTAFTIGHSFTLTLSILDIIRFNAKWVEFLIPCTIVAKASPLQSPATCSTCRVLRSRPPKPKIRCWCISDRLSVNSAVRNAATSASPTSLPLVLNARTPPR